jgi:hypothetical protein
MTHPAAAGLFISPLRGSSTLYSFAAWRAVGLAEAGLFICVNLRLSRHSGAAVDPSAVCFCFAFIRVHSRFVRLRFVLDLSRSPALECARSCRLAGPVNESVRRPQ